MEETERRTCPFCQAEILIEYRFCGHCGRALSDAHANASGEMRQITVMFCDLVGSVRLSQRLEPEAFAHVVRRYQEVCSAAIEEHDGYVAQYLGDGILAYFGYPVAVEHAAMESVHAGLEVLRSIRQLNIELSREQEISLRLRIGVHTGLVVVDNLGAGARRERLAMGYTPNLAARLQSVARPDTIVVSRDTYGLIQHAFECEDLGQVEVKGTGRPLHAFRVVEEELDRMLHDPLEGVSAALAGDRETHLDHLMNAWDVVKRGRGRVVLIEAETGIGKSHLALAFRRRLEPGTHFLIACRCRANLESSPFHPLVDWLSRILNFYPDQPADERLETLRFVTRRNGLDDPDIVPLLWSLLARHGASGIRGLEYSASQARDRLETVLEDLVLGTEFDRPILMLIEDVQWIDPSTRSFLRRLAEKIASRPMFLLVTSRSDPGIDWPPGCSVEHVKLERLGEDDIAKVVSEVAGHRNLPDWIVAQIQEKADGVPLYALEFTKMVLESGQEYDEEGSQDRDAEHELGIPATLKDALRARLDRLDTAQKVAEACSVFDRPFTLDQIRAISVTPPDEIDDAVGRLIDAGVLVEEGNPTEVRYLFRHTLLKEAAYESMLRSKAAMYHGRVARHLTESAEEDAAASAMIAYHLKKAGDTGSLDEGSPNTNARSREEPSGV